MATGIDIVDEQPKLKLYSYWRSSCSFRVRIALNLKGLKYEYIPVHLLKGEQFTPEFIKLNPSGTVPVLVDGDVVVSDSLAILLGFSITPTSYLGSKYPHHPLLPRDLQKDAINFQAANLVSSSIQPIQNLVVMNKVPVMLLSGLRKYIAENASQDEKLSCVRSHIEKGFAALEKVLKDYAGRYATGDEVYLADLFIAPQIDAAIKRFQIDMNQFPLLSRLNEEYSQLPAFCNAIPEQQPDFPSSSAN